MITLYNYEGKTKEEAYEKCIKELQSIEDLFLKEETEEGKLFKAKKYLLKAIKKSDVLEYIKEYIKNLSNGLGIEINAEVREKEDNINVLLISDNNSILIGKEGRTLNSIQVLLKQSLIAKTGMSIRVNVDASNYKSKKSQNFERDIKRIIREIKNTKMETKLDPMNSYQRRIVHTLVSEIPNMTTESIGEEPERYIVIKYEED